MHGPLNVRFERFSINHPKTKIVLYYVNTSFRTSQKTICASTGMPVAANAELSIVKVDGKYCYHQVLNVKVEMNVHAA